MKKIKTEYVRGDEAEGGFEIADILGTSLNTMIYMSRCESVRWELDDDHVPEHFVPCVQRFDTLLSRIRSSIEWRRTRKVLMESLGRALYNAFESRTADEAASCFDHVAQRIEHEVQIHARLTYVAASTVATMLVCILCTVLFCVSTNEAVSRLAIGAAAGALGAGLSVLSRAGTMEIPSLVTPLGQVFLGISRVLLGVACGVCITFLVMANLVMGIARESKAAIAAFAVLSGFSERYLPELLKNLESSPSRSAVGNS
jgi:hypothetical protein